MLVIAGRFLFLLGFSVAIAACSSAVENRAPIAEEPRDTVGLPLSELGTNTYKGLAGGLYPGRSNSAPSEHEQRGLMLGRSVVPLDQNGNPSASGKYALLSLGMSNTSNEFCGAGKTTECDLSTFMQMAAADGQVNHARLVIVNGAQGGEDAVSWDSPSDVTYAEAKRRLALFGLTERQVQVVWIKQADANPSSSLPASGADAYKLEKFLGDVVRAVRSRYPNVKQVFLSSRVYGGYATTQLNPEPYAFEGGFAVKWLIEAQIDQMRTQVASPIAGDLNYNSAAAWLAWGPYLWANGTVPRNDGLIWIRSDFNADGTHPSASGRDKVALQLLNFFKTSGFTRCWFVTGGTCN